MGKKTANLLLILALTMGTLPACRRAGSEPVDRWWDRVQTYGMVPIRMDEAKSFNLTVNGLWAGFFNTSPVVSDIKHSPTLYGKYKDDEVGFVNDMHDAGFKVVGIVPAIAGHPKIIERWPELKEATARDAAGKALVFNQEDRSLYMCGNNPAWFNWMLEQLKHAIDLGADLLTIDEIQGNTLLMFGGPCWCQYCRDGFEKYLQERYTRDELTEAFDLNSLRNLDLSKLVMLDNFDKLMAGELGYTYAQRVAESPLVGEYWRFQEQANYKHKRNLCELVRAYARSKGKYIPITSNVAGLSAVTFEGFWMKSIPYMEFIDFAAFENTTAGFIGVNDPFPEGKWIAFHKLGHAINGARNIPAPNIPTVISLYDRAGKGKLAANYLYILMAEAYANDGASVFYAFEGYLHELWAKCADFAKFVLDHKDVYDAPSAPMTPLAILYLYGEGMRNKVGAYYGLARALAEANIPYDLVFAGDGYYLEDKLSVEDLAPYSIVIIPSLLDVTNEQREVVAEFVKRGGTAVVYDEGEAPHDVGKGKCILMPAVETDKGSRDLAAAYHETNDPRYRDQLAELVEARIGGLLHVEAEGGDVSVYPCWQPEAKRLVLHVINYDHDGETDSVNEKRNVRVRLTLPEPLRTSIHCTVMSPDDVPKPTLEIEAEDGTAELTLPKLHVYNMVVIQGV